MNFFTWKTIPFVRLLIPLLLGIVLGVFVPIDQVQGLVASVLSLCCLLFMLHVPSIKWRLRLSKWIIIPLYTMIAGVGIILVDQSITLDSSTHFSQFGDATFLKGKVAEIPQAKKKSQKLVLSIEAAGHDSLWLPSKGQLLLYVQRDTLAEALEIGDLLLIPYEFKETSPPSNPGEFDYKRFLSFRDIHHQGYLRSGNWRLLSSTWSLSRTAERLRTILVTKLSELQMGDRELAIASALILGKKDELGSAQVRSFASAGAMHVLAVSGLHVGIIYMILRAMLGWLNRLRHGKLIRMVLLILALWFYALITGLSPSVVRAATMFTAVSIATGVGRRSSIYNTIASSAFVLLLINPLYLMEVGFQLSYLAVLGIIYLHPKLYALLYFPQKFADKIWEISCVSLAAQLVTFPLGLLYFHQFPTFFLVSNLLVIPAAIGILYVGICYLLTFWIPFLGAFVGKVLYWLIWILDQGVQWIEVMPGSLLEGVDISVLETWLIYTMLIAFVVALVYQLKRSFIIGLVTMALLCLMQVWEIWEYKQHEYLVVYDVRGEPAINLLSAEHNYMICSGELRQDADKQQFHLKNNWNKHDAPAPSFAIDSLAHPFETSIPGLLKSGGKRIYHLHSAQQLESFNAEVEVDYLVISEFKGFDWNRVQIYIRAEQVILDASFRPWTIERLAGESDLSAVHVLARDGYFSARL